MMIAVISTIAHAVGIPASLLLAVCWQESRHVNTINTVDGTSASYGICQVKYNTAKLIVPEIKVSELLIPEVNVFIAAKYLQKQIKRYNNNEHLAIAAYNAGKVKYNKRGLLVNNKYVNLVLDHKQKRPWRFYGEK